MISARDLILARARASNETFERLAYMCDTFGPRFSGTPALEAALSWIAATAAADGFVVTPQPVAVPVWSRGAEYAQLRSPRNKTLHFLGLGGSPGSNGTEIVAPVLVVRSYAELLARNATGQARGKIVVFNEPFVGYGATVGYRYSGGEWAASVGGVGALIRAVGPWGIQTPHTGSSSPTSPVPSGCISIEDATQLQRMQDRGQNVVIALYMEAQMLADAPSRNLLVDLVGSELPGEFVIVGGHSDSWDVAEGGMDDGGGIMASWQALRLISAAGLRPKRTVRFVAWVNEENGGRGAQAYAATNAASLNATSIMIESDEGAFSPWALSFFGYDSAFNQLRILAPLLDPLSAGNVTRAGGPPGADIGPSCTFYPSLNTPGGGLAVRDPRAPHSPNQFKNNICRDFEVGATPPNPANSISDGYFFFHHSAGDTVDVMDALQLQDAAAALAIWALTIANLPTLLPRAGAVPPMPQPAAPGATETATVGIALAVSAVGLAGAAALFVYGRRHGWWVRGTPRAAPGAAYAFLDAAR